MLRFGLQGGIMRAIPALALGAFFAVLTTPTMAQDWNGLYVGGSAGGAWGDSDTRVNCLSDPQSACDRGIALGAFSTRFSSSLDGFLAGGQIGYNFQLHRNLVLGIETDISGTSIEGSDSKHTSGASFNDQIAHVSQEIDFLGTIRGRAGYATGNWLFYATGGWAYAGVDYNYLLNIPESGRTAAASRSATKSGWIAGAGVEVGLGSRWSVKAEYLFYDVW
jgi:outer membrane immunogenic protein